MAVAKSFRDLNVYKLARESALRVFDLTKQFPKEERFSLTDQIRRSSRAVGAIIAEAWARRSYKAAFINKLNEALGEALETQSWLDASFDCKYATEDECRSLNMNYDHIGGMLRRMTDRADDFCRFPAATDYRNPSPSGGVP